MTDLKVLVTGSTGETGRLAVEELLRLGRPVRALVRRDDDRAAALRASGAEVAVGDLLDLDAVRAALDGTAAAYFVYPIRPGLIEASAFFAQAAIEAGVGAIVNMSQIPGREAESHAARDHWIAERVFDWSGVPTTHLRPTFFAQWLLYPWFRKSIVEDGVIRQPFGAGRHAPIAAEEQGRLIAAILRNPRPHAGETYTLHGPVEMHQAGIASAVGEVLGREVAYQPISVEKFRGGLEAAGLDPFLIQHLCAVAVDYQNGIFAGSNDIIKRIRGTQPMSVQEFIQAHQAAFA